MVGFVVAVAPHWKAGENGALLWCVALALWVGCLGVILRKLPFSFKDQQSGSPLVHALAGSSYHGSSVINGYQLRKQVFHQHFTLLPFQGILHVLDCPPQSCNTHPETFSRWNFLAFYICLESLEAYQLVWSSYTDLSRGHVSDGGHRACPQGVRLMACTQAGRAPAALAPLG